VSRSRKVLVALGLAFALLACPKDRGGGAAGDGATPVISEGDHPGTLESVQAAGRLRVLTPAIAKGFLPREGTPLSFEREMAEQLAEELGVELELVQPPSFEQLLPWLEQGKGDIVVASLTVTDVRARRAAFTVPLQHVKEVLVGSTEAGVPKDKAALAGKTVLARRSSSYWETLDQLKAEVPTLTLVAAAETLDTQTLLEQVGSGEVALTVADANLARAVQSYTPDLELGVELSAARPIGWAVHKQAPKLLARVNAFLTRMALTKHKRTAFTGDLDGIRRRKVLRVLTRNNGITYWLHRGREVGFEYELAKAFADKLGVRLEMVVPPARRDLIPWLREGKGDLIAAMLTITPRRQEQVDFSAPYASASEVVVTRAGGVEVKTAADLAGQEVRVRASSSYARSLKEVSAKLDKPIKVASIEEWTETEEVLRRVAEGELEITVADSNIADVEARYDPRLVIGPEVREQRPLGWAVRKGSPKLKAALDEFFTKGDFKPRGLMYNILHKRYLGAGDRQDAAHAADRSDKAGVISPYDALIRKYSARYQLDWRLIASQMYQESRFDPEAKSWVGAQGLMQIMPATAKGLDVGDVRQPENGIHGGTKYMRQLIDLFDKTLSEQQRYRFALASYNAGKGHVDDARRLAARLKLDPNDWFENTEKAMLLLEKSKYAKRARYGFCRGREPVDYVSKIQTRYEAYSEFAKK